MMIPIVDRLLNRISMYRLVLLYAAGLLGASFVLGFFKLVPNDPTALTFSATVILLVCIATNRLFATLLRIPANAESTLITAILLALILPPVTAADRIGVVGLALATFVAIASKFLLAIGRKHIFNPVAIGVFASALLLDQPATWWVGGNIALLPLVLIGGLLVVRKVQRFEMIGVYILANLVVTLATVRPDMVSEALSEALVHSPLLFAGFAMLTEPLTAPQGRWARLVYGALVGALSSPDIHIGSFYFSPETAFLVGNLFAYAASPKGRLRLTLLRIEKMAAGCYDYVFTADRTLAFQAGQYLDWTLAVPRPDDRGNRRPFTIASAPSSPEIRLGVKFHPRPSAFKQTLAAMKPGDTIYGSQLAGSFVLPRAGQEKLAFVAGGIGVTPFRSMVEDMIDRQDRRSAVLLYANRRTDEIAYAPLFDQAEQELDFRVVYAVSQTKGEEPGIHHGHIDEALIRHEIPDYRERIFYISGPQAMVTRFRKTLRGLGIAPSRIHVDFFPGFA